MDELNFVPTNTTSSLASFDLLKIDGVEDPLIDMNKLATVDVEESYFSEAVRYLIERNKEMTDAKLDLYKAIRESTDQYVVLESFSDFFTKIKEVIDKFLKFIKRLFDRFIADLAHMINSESFLKNKKHKEIIMKFNSDCEFDYDGYEYTINPNVPVASAIAVFNAELFEDLKPTGDDNGTTYLQLSDIQAARQSVIDDDYEKFRGSVLGKPDGYSISSSEFGQELFEIYRNGSGNADTFTVDYSKVVESYRNFENFNDMKKQINREQKEVETEYNKVKDQVKEISKNKSGLKPGEFLTNNFNVASNITQIGDSSMQGSAMTTDYLLYMDNYVKAKVNQITNYSDIHVLAYSAKLDALKARYRQDRDILYKAYDKVLKKGVK